MDETHLGQWMGDEEFRLSRELGKVSLFFELNLDADEIRRLQEVYGQVAGRLSTHYRARVMIQKYPASTLTALLGHAGLSYEQGRFWDGFWEELGLPREQDFEKALRAALRSLLRRYGMREFPELRRDDYVRIMTMHAGIPVHCLGDLLEVIEHHLAVGRERSGAAVFEWLTEPGMEYRLNSLDVPVRHFLQLAGEAAVDMLDRILDFIEFTAEHTEFWNDLTVDSSTTGLPTVLLDGLIDQLHERPFGQARGSVGSAARGRVPMLGFSEADRQITVGLPYPDSAQSQPWKISFDGDTRERYAERGWGVSDGAAHPLTPVPVTRPVREIVLRHEASASEHRIPVVDKRDPLLVFDIDGVLLHRRSALPRDEVFVVHPQDAVLLDAGSNEPIVSNEDLGVPSGWRGWRAHTVDLSAHDAIRLRREGGEPSPIREVRAVGAPRLELPYPLEGVSTTSGLSVYSTRPIITLPPCSRPGSQTWRVRVRYSGRAEWLSQEEWESGAEYAGLDPFDGLPSGLLGLFDIVVAGPLGSDLRATLFLAEGMSVEHSDIFRTPSPGGLSPSLSLLDADPPLSLDREGVSFDPGARDARVQVRSGEAQQTLVITPPHIEFRVDELGTPAQWRTSAQVITVAELEANAVVAARIPGHCPVDFALLDAAGTIVQIERPEIRSDNVFHVSSRVFVDTVRRIRLGELVVRVDDPEGGCHSVVMARIRPTQLCGGVRLVERGLTFETLATGELGAFVWAVTAPWRPVWQLQIDAGRAVLPDELCAAGPLLVQVFVDDPWLEITPPRRPNATAYRVEQSGWLHDENLSRDQLSRFLAGECAPPRSPDVMTEAWAALATLPTGHADTRTELLRGGLVRVLAQDPRTALEALGGSTIPPPEMVPLLIRTGLAEQLYASTRGYDHLHASPWVGCVAEIADLPYRAHTEARSEWEQMLGYLREHGGDWLISLLRGVVGDPYIGIFDRNVERAHGLPPSQIDEMLEVLSVVPEALLDDATRISAIMAAFQVRREWTAEPACALLASGAVSVLRRIRGVAPVLYDMIRARNEALTGVDVAEHRWMLLSVQSLTMAALARLSARGRFDIELMTRELREAWARLADLCPDLVATDLLIADALATYETQADLIGEHP